MTYNYFAFIIGGEGPDVWEQEATIAAADFAEASRQALGMAERMGGTLVQVEQNDRPENSADKLAALRSNLERLAAGHEDIAEKHTLRIHATVHAKVAVSIRQILAGEAPSLQVSPSPSPPPTLPNPPASAPHPPG